MSSASHARSSPTKHWPFIFAMPKRLFILVRTTFITSWSPGTTGLRNLTPSMPVEKYDVSHTNCPYKD